MRPHRLAMGMALTLAFGLASLTLGSAGCASAPALPEASVAPADLFEPLRLPYRQAFTATRYEDRAAARASVQQMLQFLEGLRLADPARWPDPYGAQPDLVHEAIQLFVTQTKVAGLLNLTGDYHQAHQTLEELGVSLSRVRVGLGVWHPTDHFLVIHEQIKLIERGLAQPQVDWQAQRHHLSQLERATQRLAQGCPEPTLWASLAALGPAAAAQDRDALARAAALARAQFYRGFARCG